jgi:cytoskeletal protein CcmA (bactofilin family)
MTRLDLDLVPEPPSSPAVMAARQRRALVVGLGGGRQGESVMGKPPFAERRLRASDTVSTRFVDPLPGVDVAASRRSGLRDGPSAEAPCMSGDAPESVGQGDAAASAAASAATPGRASAFVPDGPSAPKDAAPNEGGDPADWRAAASASAPDAAVAPSSPSSTVAPPSPSANACGLRLDDALVVPAGALMRGYLRCHALLLVGDVVGNVHCTAGPVVIRSGASLKGRLVATGDVYVCGTVGDSGGGAVITTRGKLTLAPGARVDGDVRSGWLDVYDGAALNGVARRCED